MNNSMLQIFFDMIENRQFMNSFLDNYQIPQSILIQTHGNYDSNKCLKTQLHITPYFCFKYLYNMSTDTYDNKIDYNDIIYKFKNKYTTEELNNIYNNIYEDVYNVKNKNNIN